VACRRGKRRTAAAQRYAQQVFDHLLGTAQALQSRLWRPPTATAFIVTRPKAREVLAAPFGDRVAHHLLVPHLERHFEPRFIFDAWSNRKGKGIHGAVARLPQQWRWFGAQGPHWFADWAQPAQALPWLLLVQVGSALETHGHHARRLGAAWPLHGGQAIWRRGLGWGLAWPLHQRQRLFAMAHRLGWAGPWPGLPRKACCVTAAKRACCASCVGTPVCRTSRFQPL